MDPKWVIRNIRSAWIHRDEFADFLKRIVWIYSSKIPSPKNFEIGFTYSAPIGKCRLFVRANSGADAFIHGEVFEHDYYKLPLPIPPASILDLGANAGFTAVYFSRSYPDAKIACVEPMPNNVESLRRNLKLNGIKAVVFAAAAAVRDGAVAMRRNAKDYGHQVAFEAEDSSIQVTALSLATILNQLGWNRIGLLKIDIEGYERLLLQQNTQWLERVDNICIECHGDFGERDLARVANAHGFASPLRLPGIWLLTRE